MKDLIIPESINVINIEAEKDFVGDRMRLYFSNGLGISIIQGQYTYGGKDGLYEIAALDKTGDLDGSLLNLEDDNVIGYLTKEEVLMYCKKISDII